MCRPPAEWPGQVTGGAGSGSAPRGRPVRPRRAERTRSAPRRRAPKLTVVSRPSHGPPGRRNRCTVRSVLGNSRSAGSARTAMPLAVSTTAMKSASEHDGSPSMSVLALRIHTWPRPGSPARELPDLQRPDEAAVPGLAARPVDGRFAGRAAIDPGRREVGGVGVANRQAVARTTARPPTMQLGLDQFDGPAGPDHRHRDLDLTGRDDAEDVERDPGGQQIATGGMPFDRLDRAVPRPGPCAAGPWPRRRWRARSSGTGRRRGRGSRSRCRSPGRH